MIGVKRTLRVYADTSVFGGCFDDEFRAESVEFFEEVRAGRFVLVVSDVTLDELGLAPEPARRILADLPQPEIEAVNSSEESNAVGAGHARPLHASVVGPASSNDAAHIACVQMKIEIQERLLREIAELGEEEAARRRRDRLARDPILGAFLERKTAS
jgi:hypothetical protein